MIKKDFDLNKSRYIPVSKPFVAEEDKVAVMQALDSGWVSGEGPVILGFEKNLSATFRKNFAVSCNSGTAAIDLAVAALNLGPEDHVVCPSFTIGSCCFELVRRGVKLGFIDSELETFNPTEDAYLGAIKSNTKALVIPHIYGFCVDVPRIKQKLEGSGIYIIEDCAESQFMRYPSGGYVGTEADIMTLSFYANKTVVAGEGGAVLCDDSKLSERLLEYRNLCFDPNRRFFHTDIGWNYRLGSLNAALANSQLKRGFKSNEEKIEIGTKYYLGLKGIDEVYVPPPKIGKRNNGYWVVPIILKDSDRAARDRFVKYLSDKGIGNRPFFEPLHLQKIFCYEKISLKNSEILGDTGLYVPSFLGMLNTDIEYVIETIWRYFR